MGTRREVWAIALGSGAPVDWSRTPSWNGSARASWRGSGPTCTRSPAGPIPTRRTPRRWRWSLIWSPSSGRSTRWPPEGNRDDDQVSRSRNRIGSGGLPHPRATPRTRTGPGSRSGKEPGRSQSAAGQSAPGGRCGRYASVRAQVHVGRDRLGTGGRPERRANWPRGGRVRENRLGGVGTGPLHLGSGPTPRSGRGCARARPGGAGGS